MNTPTTFTRAIEATGRARGYYALLGAATIFMVGGTLFTILQTVRITATVNSVPSLVYLFMAIYLTLQLILAVSFAFALRAALTVLALHTGALLLSGLVVLPLLGHGDKMAPTLLAGTPFFILTIALAFGRQHLIKVPYAWILVVIYTLCLVSTLYLNGMMLL